MQIQEIGQRFEVPQRIRHALKLVVAEIEHTKMFQTAEALGNLTELVLGEHQRFEFNFVPNGIRHALQSLLPQD